MAVGFLNCVKARMSDMYLPFPADWFTGTLGFVTFLRSASAVLKSLSAFDGVDYTVGQVIRIMVSRGLLTGAAGAEVAFAEVLAVAGSFYFGALAGAFLICTAERLIKGPDKYTPKLSVNQMKQQFKYKVKADMPETMEKMIAVVPEMRGAEPDDSYPTRLQYYGKTSSDSSDTEYA
jgi:hypothetical protein